MRGKSLALGCAILLAAVATCTAGLFGGLMLADYLDPRAVEDARQALGLPVAPRAQASPTALPATAAGGAPPLLAPASLPELYEATSPGVVNITAFGEQSTLLGGTYRTAGQGSGFIYDREGHIVTNNHVVSQATELLVRFWDGTNSEARVVGADADSDLAVIKVNSLPDDARVLELGDSSSVRPGQSVVAIGNPFGYQGTMTYGIVSAVGRTIESGVQAPGGRSFSIPEVIQTDAPINPGNSGGPLLDLSGRVIGVNAQIRTAGSTAVNSGVGFAIPASIVRRVVPVLMEHGVYRWPWIGVELASLPQRPDIVEANRLSMERGAYVSGVVRGGPAEGQLRGTQRYLQESDGDRVPLDGDVIVSIDGREISSSDDIIAYVSMHKQVGDEVVLGVLRDGRAIEVIVRLAERPANRRFVGG
jgi:2-alkenal reductase